LAQSHKIERHKFQPAVDREHAPENCCVTFHMVIDKYRRHSDFSFAL
jgi:hypothetical protein